MARHTYSSQTWTTRSPKAAEFWFHQPRYIQEMSSVLLNHRESDRPGSFTVHAVQATLQWTTRLTHLALVSASTFLSLTKFFSTLYAKSKSWRIFLKEKTKWSGLLWSKLDHSNKAKCHFMWPMPPGTSKTNLKVSYSCLATKIVWCISTILSRFCKVLKNILSTSQTFCVLWQGRMRYWNYQKPKFCDSQL